VTSEQALERAAAAGIHRLQIPTPFAVGRVNCYLIDDDPLTLVDTGPNSGKALDELQSQLAGFGHSIDDLELVVLTHQHVDHVGLAEIIVEHSGAEVAALDLLAPWVEHWSEAMDADDAFAERVMAEHGIPEDVRHALIGVSQSYRGWGAAATVTRPLAPGSQLRLRDRTLRVHHRPGHSPSDTIFHDEGHGIVLGADHLIKHISSNPLISRPLAAAGAPHGGGGGGGGGETADRPHALEIYIASLRATRAMENVDLVLAGHGEPVTDHVALIDERFRLHKRRAEKIRRLIAQAPITAYEIAQALWGNVAVTQAYLTLSEVLGHVDLLVTAGRVVEQRDGGLVRFAAAG